MSNSRLNTKIDSLQSSKHIMTHLLRYPPITIYRSHIENPSLTAATVKTTYDKKKTSKVFSFMGESQQNEKNHNLRPEDIANLLCYGSIQSPQESHEENDNLLKSLC